MNNNGLIVRPDKNLFMLYALLDTLGLMRGDMDGNPIRKATHDHFIGYEGLDTKKLKKTHHCHYVTYVLTRQERQVFLPKPRLLLSEEMKDMARRGGIIEEHLIRFQRNTDFKEFYRKIRPHYKFYCQHIDAITREKRIEGVLDKAWEMKRKIPMVVIPIPLEAGGIGPSMNGVSYAVIGFCHYDSNALHLIAHEGSHTRAKIVLAPYLDEIRSNSHLYDHLKGVAAYSKDYITWPICFEEHFIRALQEAVINPELIPEFDVQERLQREVNKCGMVLIYDFYEEILKHKAKSRRGNLGDVVPKILKRLNDKKRL